MSNEADKELAAELAAISIVTSEDIVAASGNTARLAKIQDELDDARDAVSVTKEILENLEGHELTPELALVIDKSLAKPIAVVGDDVIKKNLEAVGGLEDLGYTLLPSEFIASRIQGCEDLLSSIKKTVTSINTRVGRFFKETVNNLTVSRESLEKNIERVEQLLKDSKLNTKSDVEVELSNRVFNLFQIDGKFNPSSIVGDMDKTSRALKALYSFYCVENAKVINGLLKYFGEFEGMDSGAGMGLLFKIDERVPDIHFKEAKIKVGKDDSGNYKLTKSKDIMGGYHFLDKRMDTKVEIKTYADVDKYYRLRKEEKLSLVRDPKVHTPDSLKFKAFTKDQISALIRLIQNMIKDWKKTDLSDKSKDTLFREFQKTVEVVNLNPNFDETFKETAFFAFLFILERTQNERIQLEASVNKYLVNMFLGIINYIELSIEARKEG